MSCLNYLNTIVSKHIFCGNYDIWSPSAFSRRAVVSYWRKYVHQVLVNRLGGLSLPRKSVVRLTDRPDMTLDVYRGRKTAIQQQQNFSWKEHIFGKTYPSVMLGISSGIVYKH